MIHLRFHQSRLNAGMKVLVATHRQELRERLLNQVQEWNLDGVGACDGEQAWQVLAVEQQGQIDLLISDVATPVVTGLELAKRLRQKVDYSTLPVLLICENANKRDVMEAAQMGVSGFLTLPLDTSTVRKKVFDAIRSHRKAHVERQARLVWENRIDQAGGAPGPLIVIGEPVTSLKELRQPEYRETVSYLDSIRQRVDYFNDRYSSLSLGYVLESDTADILLHLKRHTTRDSVKLILLSAKCHGNPTLIARLFAINRSSASPFFLVYDKPDDLPAKHRDSLKKLGIKTMRRSNLDSARLDELIEHYAVDSDSMEVLPTEESESVMTATQVQNRISADMETMTSLPPLPQVYEKISALSRDPESDMKDWINAIRIDPMTSATIMRQANSLAYGFKGEVREIDRAVILLGKNTVAGLVASDAVRQAFTAVQEAGFVLEDFWVHNLAVGFAAHVLSLPVPEIGGNNLDQEIKMLGLGEEALETLRTIDLPKRLRLDQGTENPFVGGMMHDIGKGVMVHSYPGLYPLLIAELETQDWKVPMEAAEREVSGGLTHTVAGGILMRKWGMDEALCGVVANHHQPDIDDTYAFLVGIADVIGQVLYPFPRKAAYPIAEALEDGELRRASRFFPAGFFDQPLLSESEFLLLARTITPGVKGFAEKLRRSIRE